MANPRDALNLEELDLEDEEEEEEEPVTGEQLSSSVIKELRRRLKEASKELKRKNKQLSELAAFKQSQEASARKSQLKEVFKESGLQESWAELFLAVNPDKTEFNPEEIVSWATNYGLTVQREQPKPAAAPITTGQPGGPGLISYEQYREMVSRPETHQQAIDLRRAGMVKEELSG